MQAADDVMMNPQRDDREAGCFSTATQEGSRGSGESLTGSGEEDGERATSGKGADRAKRGVAVAVWRRHGGGAGDRPDKTHPHRDERRPGGREILGATAWWPRDFGCEWQ